MVVSLWSVHPGRLVVFGVVVSEIRLRLTVQAKGKDDESVSDLMMSSQTKGN